MIIRQKRIRNLGRHLPENYKEHSLQVGLTGIDTYQDQLRRVGFSDELNIGEKLLPKIVGPVSRFNAEGKYVRRRGEEKEIAYREVEWHWKERHGDREVEQSGFRYVPYSRYPRDLIPPPSIELQISDGPEDQPIVTIDPIEYNDENYTSLVHAINLLLEIFGECQVWGEELPPIRQPAIRRLNWRILPSGRYPWEQLRQDIQPILDSAKQGNRAPIARRLELLNSKGAEFVAVGQGGFTGYVVYGFPAKNLYVLESTLYGNATYVFEQNWERLSGLTKAEILNEDLHKARFIHHPGWDNEIEGLLR